MARPKLGDSETERLHMKITKDELQAIEDWRYANRVPSKSEAVRRLVQIGLVADARADETVKITHKLLKASGEQISDAKGEAVYEVKLSPVDVFRAHHSAAKLARLVVELRKSGNLDEVMAAADAALSKMGPTMEESSGLGMQAVSLEELRKREVEK